MSQTKDWIYVDQASDIFRKIESYTLEWNIENTRLVPSNFGGPIACTRDISKQETRPTILIYSPSGTLIKSFQFESKFALVGLDWTCREDLVIVKDIGEIELRSMHGSIQTLFSIVKTPVKIVDFRVFNTINAYSGTFTTGIVVLTSKNKFVIVKDLYDPKLLQFPEMPGSLDLDAWCIVSTEKKCFILTSRGNEINQLVIGGSVQPLRLNLSAQYNRITHMVCSFANDLLALSTDTGYLIMCNSDVTRIIHKYQASQSEPCKQLAWVARNAVVAFWDSLFLIPLEGDNINNGYEIYASAPLYLVQEIDGVRIITSDKSELLQVVPKPLRDVFELGASNPASILYDASLAFYEQRNQVAEEYIRSLKGKVSSTSNSLEEAIDTCILAAPHEFEPKYQIELMRASLFGRYFSDYSKANAYVKMCQTIRVLNAIRHIQIGMPVTYVQYEALSIEVIVDRLILRRHFALAIEIVKYLEGSESERNIVKILSNWALYKVGQKEIDDSQIALMIKSKLGDTPGISYAEIARSAIVAGRPNLAIKLLEFESKASEQVPLYIQIGNADLALKKAMESGDSDLIYMVLFWLQEKYTNWSDFMKSISKNTLALNLMLQYYRQKKQVDKDSQEFSNILNQENRILEQANYILKVAQKQDRIDQKLQMLDEVRRLFGNDEKFNATLLSDEIKLIKLQITIDKNFRTNLTGKPLYATIGELIKANLGDEAEKLRKEFKISDSSEIWWHLKTRNLCKGHLWDELEKFGKAKKSVIGFEPFVTYCMDENNIQEAKKYFPRVAPENRFKCLLKMKCLNDALDIAKQNKDILAVSLVISKCNLASQKPLIERAKAVKQELMQKS